MTETSQHKDEVEQILSLKCKIHTNYICDLLNLSANSEENVRICFQCLKTTNIPSNQVISLRLLFESSEATVISGFVPVDQKIIEENILRLEDNPEQYLDIINQYYDQMQQQLSSLIQERRNKAQLQIKELIERKKQALQVYNNLAQKDSIKEIFFQSKTDVNQTLFEWIKLRRSQKADNSDKLQPSLDLYLAYLKRFEINQADEIKNKLLEQIKSIDFFPPSCSILDKIAFVPTAGYQNSAKNIISQRIEHGHLKISCVIDANSRRQGYLNFILNPSVKYVFTFKISQNSNSSPDFDIGLLPESNKDKDHLGQFNVTYCESSYNSGIQKRIKGGSVWSDYDARNVQRQLELRIHLSEKIFKIGDYPSYNRVTEISNPNKIDLNQQYYLAICMCYLKDSITIMQAKEVQEFDENM